MGWRFPIQFSDLQRRVDILIPESFPFSPARIALVDRPDFLTWPHVERDGVLCLLQSHGTISIDEPDGGIGVLLGLAFDLVERCVKGKLDEDFKGEFRSYWMNSATTPERPALSLLTPSPPSRLIRVWNGPQRAVLGETDEQIFAWLKNRNPGLTAHERRLVGGMLLWLDNALIPADFPKTANGIRLLAVREGAVEILDEIAQQTPDSIFVAIGSTTANGPAIVGTEIKRPVAVRNNDPLTRGFRPSRVPEPVFTARYFGAQAAGRNPIDRVDPSWIHGRDHDARVEKLQNATVVIAGCGSVGAPVAFALARAGVRRLILVDKDALEGANVGRHPLGVPSIGKHKATELARRLREELPHLQVDSHVSNIQDILRPDSPLQAVDLIVSALGDWPGESMLDEWHATSGCQFPIVYGWTEAYAAAGHAVIVTPPHGRFRDGVDAAGRPYLVVTQWAAETRKYEPACGAAFEPYGPVELGFVTSLVAQAALDSLLGSVDATHRIWLGRRKTLEAAGGQWSPALRHIAPHAVEGGTIIERRWDQLPTTKVQAA